MGNAWSGGSARKLRRSTADDRRGRHAINLAPTLYWRDEIGSSSRSSTRRPPYPPDPEPLTVHRSFGRASSPFARASLVITAVIGSPTSMHRPPQVRHCCHGSRQCRKLYPAYYVSERRPRRSNSTRRSCADCRSEESMKHQADWRRFEDREQLPPWTRYFRQWSRDVGMPDAIADVLVLCVEAHERAIDPGAGIVTDAEERSGQTLSDEQLHQLSLSAHAEVQFQMQARGIRLVEERLPSERVKSLKGLIVREVRRRIGRSADRVEVGFNDGSAATFVPADVDAQRAA